MTTPGAGSGGGPCELLHKVLVIGDGGTGKTCLIRRYVHNIFQATNKATIGVDFALKVLTQKNRNITLQIWDIAGQERHGQMTRVYYQAAVGAVVVCDVTKPETFDATVLWKRDLDSKVFLGASGKNVPCILCVNKCDLQKCPRTKEEMDKFCKEHGFAAWFETSAKEDTNVGAAFEELVQHVLQATQSANMEPAASTTTSSKTVPKQTLGQQPGEKKKCPC